MAKKLGLALGSGAARGWAHVGVLKGLEELNLKPDVIAGTSAGALVGGAYLADALDAFAAWARELSPLSALSNFSVNIARGGLIDSRPAFEAFAAYDKDIAELPARFGAVATDLGDGEEVWLTEGSLLEATRASSAIPVLLQSVERGGQWLADGALSNPVPVSLARHLGADVVVAVDLTDVAFTLDRFKPSTNLPALRPDARLPKVTGEDEAAPVAQRVTDAVVGFIQDTRARIDEEMAFARARQLAKPQLFETAFAAVDIFQMHLGRARRGFEPPDICLTPDMRDALPNAFDRADHFVDVGRAALLAKADELRALLGD
ncbi:MAG: patatin-like phospholipase family protein [Parvularculaceae bacterium]